MRNVLTIFAKRARFFAKRVIVSAKRVTISAPPFGMSAQHVGPRQHVGAACWHAETLICATFPIQNREIQMDLQPNSWNRLEWMKSYGNDAPIP